MIIGVDFDNTIVCYDPVFHKIALEKGIIPADVPPIKDEIRNYLRDCGKVDTWTELQGFVYGPGTLNAKPFEGVLDFFMHCKKHKIMVCIISHKTLYPFLGSKYNLHKFARQWLEKQGFYESKKIGISEKDVFFELTKEEKLKRIAKQGCTHYIDDLPEFLTVKNFPEMVSRILFDPNGRYKNENSFERIESWSEMTKKVK